MSDELRNLLNKAKELLDSGQKDEYLEELLNIFETHKDAVVIYLLFVQYISRSNYKMALHYLLLLKHTNTYMNDYYTYMLLISNFVNIPDVVKESLINLEDDEFLLSYKDTRFENIKLNNLARKAIAEGKYKEAFRYMKSIRNRYKLESQEYVICRMLDEKINKQQKRFIKAFKEERYEDILKELNIIQFPSLEERTIIELLYDICDIRDGIIFNRKEGNSKDLFGAIYDRDYQKALTFIKDTDNELIGLLLQRINELTKRNIVEQYKGNLGNLFYDYCYRINDAIEQSDYGEISALSKEYLNIIEHRYNNFVDNLVDYYEAIGNGIENILKILADLSYRKSYIDLKYLEELFYDAMKVANYEAVEYLLEAIDSLRKEDQEKINFEYLKELYNNRQGSKDSTEMELLTNNGVAPFGPVENVREVDFFQIDIDLYEKLLIESSYMYNIPNIELIINEVINEGATINDVTLKYDISDDDVSFVIALIARECYKAGKIELGDQYYRYAHNEDNKEPEYRYLLETINTNKNAYSLIGNDSFSHYVKKLVNKSLETNE